MKNVFSNLGEDEMTIGKAAKEWDLPRRAVKLLCKWNHLGDSVEKRKAGLFKRYCIKKSCCEPDNERLFLVGYDYPAHCFTILTICRRFFRSNLKRFFLVLGLAVLVLLCFIIDFRTIHATKANLATQAFQMKQINELYAIYTFIMNALFSGVLIIYFFVSDTIDNKINSVSTAFTEYEDGKPNDNYIEFCKWYYTWSRCPLPQKTISRCKNIKRSTTEKVTIDARGKKPFGVWLLFCIIWGTTIGLAIYFSLKYTDIVSVGISGYLTLFLFFFSMVLLSQSYYNSLLFTAFFQLISGFANMINVKQYKHNKETPSQTTGLVQLLGYANDNAGIFLVVSIILSGAMFLLLQLRSDKTTPIYQYLSIVGLLGCNFIFALVSAIVVGYGPRFMLRRVLKIWVNKQRETLENELYEAEKQKYKKKAEDLGKKIKELQDEKIDLYSNLPQLALTIIGGFIAPVITFILSYIST